MVEPVGSRMEGRVALVTGAGNGIGRACAMRLAREGARIAVADLDLNAAKKTVDGLSQPGMHVPLLLDVTDSGSVDDAV